MLDHLLWGVPNLEAGLRDFARRSTVTAAIGGRHPGIGTHNALLDLEGHRYLEIIAADPSQDRFTDFGLLLQELREPSLLTWAARTNDISTLAKRVREVGLEPSEIATISRQRPDGELFRGRLLQLAGHPWGPLMPFFIQIDEGSHPSQDAPTGCRLASFTLEHPQPRHLRSTLASLWFDTQLDVEVRQGQRPRLQAKLDTPSGRITLVGTPTVADGPNDDRA